MQLAVKHTLELVEPDSFCLPINEAPAMMGETVTGFLARAGWRFDLPTICLINGECYGRAEWPTRALAVNDNVEFFSRPLGSGSAGSTAKSIGSIVALVALTALVPGAVAGLGGAFATAGGALSTLGSLTSAAIIGAGAAPLAAWLVPPAPWWRRTLMAARDSLRSVLAVAARFWSPAR